MATLFAFPYSINFSKSYRKCLVYELDKYLGSGVSQPDSQKSLLSNASKLQLHKDMHHLLQPL